MVVKKSFRMFAVAVAILAQTVSFATHIIGGELYYDYLGNNMYQVTLTLFRDCSGVSFDAEGRITVRTGSGGLVSVTNVPTPPTTFVPVELDTPCLTLPPDLCIETVSYVTVLELPPSPDGYHLIYQRCCRQGDIVNIMNPDDIGITCTITVPPTGNEENSSARFNALPPIALCLNEPLVFDHSASEPDGDSLVYALATPYAGGAPGAAYPNPAAAPPYNLIPWADPYTEEYQIDSEPMMAIDPVTGLLTVQPTVVGNFVCGVGVKEYRNGVLLSETIRDFLFSVVPCNATVIAALEPQTEFCNGELSLTVGNNSIGGQIFDWDFGDPNTNADTSSAANPTWVYDEYGTYTITLIINPGALCADTAEVTYLLYPTPEPYFEVPEPACGPFDTTLTAQGMSQENSTVAWYLGLADPSFSSSPVVDVAFDALGSQLVTLTITEDGCTGAYDGYVVANPLPEAYFVADPPSPQPFDSDILFTDQSNGNGGSVINYIWSSNGVVLSEGPDFWEWETAQPGTYNFNLEILTDQGCTSTYSMTYVITPGDVDIPNVFTPNGDGLNDTFEIEHIDHFENHLVVYSRWGNVVYETSNYRNQWRAPNISDGTYFYVLTLGDGRELTGHVTILR